MAKQETEFTDFEIQVPGLDEATPWDGVGADAIPEGEYVLRVANMEQKTSNNNNPMVLVTSEVVETLSDMPEGTPDLTGRKVFQNYALTPKALGRIRSLQVAVGASLGAALRASEFIGASYRATVVHNLSQASPDANGNVREPKIFANVQNERPLEDQPAATTSTATNGKSTAPTPPVMNKPATTKTTTRRA